MSNLKLMKAQAKLALTRVEPRLEVSIVNYITALEKKVESDEKLKNLVDKMTGVVMGVSDLRTSDGGRTYPTHSLCDKAEEILKEMTK